MSESQATTPPHPVAPVEVTEATEATPELVAAFDRLVPHLSKSNPPPTADEVAAMVASDASIVLIARDPERDGEIVGTLTLAVFRIPTGRRAWIEDVIVDPRVERRGIGAALTNAAIERARQLPVGPLRTEFNNGLIIALSQYSPSDAAGFAASLPGRELKGEAIGVLVENWTRADPAAAAGWVSAFPSGDLRTAALNAVSEQWARTDPQRAGKWLSTLPADASRDAAFTTYTQALAVERPQLASTHVASIRDPEQRQHAIESVARFWMKTNPTAARAWLTTLGQPAP